MAGIYLHFPFCKSKCNYCDFYSKINLSSRDILVKHEILELILRKKYIENEIVNSIYFGGGTPSLLSIHQICDILTTIRHNFSVSIDCEITFEANPEDLTEEYVSSLISYGINRLSIGIQSFNDNILKFLGRRHDSSNLTNVINIAKRVGFSNISVDLIFGVPGFKNEDYFSSLDDLIVLDIQHVSTYFLTIEKNTYFYKLMKENKFYEISENEMINQFNYTIDFLKNNGFEHYEVSNFCRNGYVSKHNSSYWSNAFFLGIGPSAHSFNGISRQWNVSSIKKYCLKVCEVSDFYSVEYLTEIDKYNEYILTGLRTAIGIKYNYVYENFGAKIFLFFSNELTNLLNTEFIIRSKDTIVLTRKGILVSDYIIRQLFYS